MQTMQTIDPVLDTAIDHRVRELLFGAFSITDWLGHTPKSLLAKNFGVPESEFASFPKSEVYFAKGKRFLV